MIASTRPELSGVEYAAMLLDAIAVAAAPLTCAATAVAQKYWHIDYFDACRDDSQGLLQLPGNVEVPSDIATAPTLTKDPPRPIRVPSDTATVSTVSQGNELAS
jgi:predicted YcjX-like family ATPase